MMYVERDPALAGFTEWWSQAKAYMRTEAEKLEAFWRGAGELRSVLAELPSLRSRVQALKQRVAALAPAQRQAVAARMNALERKQAEVESGGAGLAANVAELVQRADAGARGTGALLPYGSALGELGAFVAIPAWVLIAGLGAIAGFLAAKIADYLGVVAAHKKELELAEGIVADMRAGQLTPEQAARLLETLKPPKGWWEELGKAGGLLAAGALLVFVLPMLTGGGRR